MTCRICLENGGHRFCKCKGTSLVHEKCLLKWIKESGRNKCEICDTPFVVIEEYKCNPTLKKSFSPTQDPHSSVIIFIPAILIILVTTVCEILLEDYILGVITTNIAVWILLMVTIDEAKTSCAGLYISLLSLLSLAFQRNNSTEFQIAIVVQSSITALFALMWMIQCTCVYNLDTTIALKRYAGHFPNNV